MNSTTGTGGFLSSSNIGGFGYGIGVSVGVLLLVTTITLASYYCSRYQDSTVSPLPRNRARAPQDSQDHIVEIGLDEATLLSYPEMLYSEVKEKNGNPSDSCCSICLGDYKDSDMLRSLPECGHLFHVKCVDPWLRMHPTCPVCRTSPLPTPLSTPLAEVVPLRTRPLG